MVAHLLSKHFRFPHGVVPNMLALTYTLLGYSLVILLLALRPHGWWADMVAVLLISHTLIFSAYFVHEFAHQTVFRSPTLNTIGGEVMGWLCGSCYAPFSSLRKKHLRHHSDKADIVTFDYKVFMGRQSNLCKKVLLGLEWAYIPAVEFIMHGVVMLMPFWTDSKEKATSRPRVLVALAMRGAALIWLGCFSGSLIRFAATYALCYIIMLHTLRFIDCYQHTYDAYYLLECDAKIPNDKVRDHKYEQENTFSNIFVDTPWLNYLFLNFGYHNAHHERVTTPWHDLPASHKALYQKGYPQTVDVWSLLRIYHRYRVTRVLSEDYGAVSPGNLDGFYGAVGVSFLTAV